MIANGSCGESTKTGLLWEENTDFKSFLSDRFVTCGNDSELMDLTKGRLTGIFLVPKNSLYTFLFSKYGIVWEKLLSKRIFGDEIILNTNKKIAYVIEKKSQKIAGSVDEKLQTCHFKKIQFEKVFSSIGFKVEYIYLLNDWFRQSQYTDMINYVESVGCGVYFNKIEDSKFAEILSSD